MSVSFEANQHQVRGQASFASKEHLFQVADANSPGHDWKYDSLSRGSGHIVNNALPAKRSLTVSIASSKRDISRVLNSANTRPLSAYLEPSKSSMDKPPSAS
eukprot:CAMPEP_0113720608 /NCGR_PEP_ID=MMETSP0038_2-20120614/36580_1 /TAXON_ID=2898 /ORGANISM="Cryptomonas paramecium" /LENGTH=101 /DNA_ID=CAMNT_0000649341 /DNA_START=123 /DNA_END=425 /DNA_ORIENTATION=- /assembly_acc=CAM_ASM_000170